MEFDRKKMVQAFEAAHDCGPYDELPVLRADRDPQLHLSRNDRPQPFFLICSSDTLLAQLAGTRPSTSSTRRFSITGSSPATSCTSRRGRRRASVPRRRRCTSATRRCTRGSKGSRGSATRARQEVHREEFDTAEELSQDGYWRACTTFNADVELRRCPECGEEHERVDLTGIRWPEVAQAIRETAR